MSVARPESPHLSKKAMGAILISIWMVSIFLAFPTLLYSTTKSYGDSHDITRHTCLLVWPDGNSSESLYDHIYQVTFFLVTYVLPMVGLTITYTHLGMVLLRTDYQDQSVKPSRCHKDKRKVSRFWSKQ